MKHRLDFCFLIALHVLFAPQTWSLDVLLDGGNEGKRFDGIGSVSAGASTRLLIDYPEPQRSEVLDLLFKPGVGASFQHLKVEIGGEVNSTDGTEPTHMRSRDDLDFTRGYEWWLMKEAKKRNPDIILDCLAWGAPAWIGGGNYHSQDMADYIANFIEGAKSVHNLEINFTGIWNERTYDVNWIKLLRRTLDQRGLSRVRIVAADEYRSWSIVERLLADPELRACVYAVGSHYSDEPPASIAELNMPIWSTEHGGWAADWAGTRFLGKALNRNYVKGKLTRTEMWALVSSYYNVLELADSGPMLAREPWTGHYETQPALWILAHTTQFAQPGWTYLAGNASALLPGGGSMVTLKSTNGTDYAFIIETFDATAPQKITVALTNGLSTAEVKIWRSTQTLQFYQMPSISPVSSTFSFTAEPDNVYTLTTLTNGQKGLPTQPPPSKPFPLPYREDFEAVPLHGTPRYISDQYGTFEVVAREDGMGKALRQIVLQQGIRWNQEFTPFTVVGDKAWTDYEMSADVLLEGDGFISLYGRMESNIELVPIGYYVHLFSNPGRYELWGNLKLIGSGPIQFSTNTWHKVRWQFLGDAIRLDLDGQSVFSINDGSYASGFAGLGCGWHGAQFDNFVVSQLHAGYNVAPQASVSASSTWQSYYAVQKAVDGDLNTTWLSTGFTNQWVQFDFTNSQKLERLVISELAERVTSWKMQAFINDNWIDLVAGGPLRRQRAARFPATSAQKFRFLVGEATGWPGLNELQLFAANPSRTVMINEWMLHNTSSRPDPASGAFEPWFEFYNPSDSSVDLSGYFIQQGFDASTRFQVPKWVQLKPHGTLLVWADGSTNSGSSDPFELHVPFRLSEGLPLALFDPAGNCVDAVQLVPSENDVALGSNPDGSATISQVPFATPGTGNKAVVVRSARKGAGDFMEFLLQGIPFATHRLEQTADPVHPEWNVRARAQADGAGYLRMTEPLNPGQSSFFRAVAE